jgi:epoxide hydrolase-like predicted phosphatase
VAVKAVLFDFGGVLVRMVDDRPRMKLAKELGVSLSKLDNLVFFSETAQQASRGEITVTKHWEAVGSTLGIKSEALPAFLERYWSADDVNWKLLDFIRSLRPRYKVGLLSNAWDDLRQTLHNRWNIDGLFDEMIISAEVKMVKPEPRIFHLAVDRLGAKPEETIFIDDIVENIESAIKQGLIALQFTDTQLAIAKIDEYLEKLE